MTIAAIRGSRVSPDGDRKVQSFRTAAIISQ